MKKGIVAVILAAAMLCGCSSSSREDELQSQIDELRSQLENQDGKGSSNTDNGAKDINTSKSEVDSAYDGIDWNSIPEASASDFGYRVFYGYVAEDPDYMAGYTGDGSEFIKSIFIFDYYGHDKYVKIPKGIDGLPVTVMGSLYGEGYRTLPWDPGSEWLDVHWDNSVFRDSNVENIFIPEYLRTIYFTAFNDCPTLKSISVDPNNLAFFSEDGVLFIDRNVIGGAREGCQEDVYAISPQQYPFSAESAECVRKTPDLRFYYCYIDSSLTKSCGDFGQVVKFTDGTYGVRAATGKYIPIEENQFKRRNDQSFFRYPEGKHDKSYTVKNALGV